MAYNRMYLRCKSCGACFFLAKANAEYGYYTDEEYYRNGGMVKELNCFLKKHKFCNEPKKEPPYEYDEQTFPLPEGFEECFGAFDIVHENEEGTGVGEFE